jgi:hypothetical protein
MQVTDHVIVIRINTPAIFYDDLVSRHSHGTRIHVWAFWDHFRFDSFYRHNYQFEEQYSKQKFLRKTNLN